jgi:hypothetical protein
MLATTLRHTQSCRRLHPSCIFAVNLSTKAPKGDAKPAAAKGNKARKQAGGRDAKKEALENITRFIQTVEQGKR